VLAASQSGLAPENLTTLPHFSVSSAINFLKPSGDCTFSSDFAPIATLGREPLVLKQQLAKLGETTFVQSRDGTGPTERSCRFSSLHQARDGAALRFSIGILGQFVDGQNKVRSFERSD
jgi:hypothetical protein